MIVAQGGFPIQATYDCMLTRVMLRPLMHIPDRPIAVIDTQVLMDWLVFRDARIAPLVEAITGARLRWIATPAMHAELLHVLGRGVAASWAPDLTAINVAFERWRYLIGSPAPPAVRLVCRDPDDQMFIDLALAERARWLISRDRAVLALAKRARPHGVEILTPEAWLRTAPTDLAPSNMGFAK